MVKWYNSPICNRLHFIRGGGNVMAKWIRLLFVFTCILLIVGCSNSDLNVPTSQPKGSDTITIEVLQLKVEIIDALDALARDFEKIHPNIKVIIDTVGGGEDYNAILRARFNSGSPPNIFHANGPQDIIDYVDFLTPLNDQPWVKHVVEGSLDKMTKDGKIYGQPIGIEGYGIIYHKSMFEQAGINPYDITSLSALRTAFRTLESMKEELGIETVLSYSVGDTAWWTASFHTFNVAFSMQEDPFRWVHDIDTGKARFEDNDRIEGMLNLLDLFCDYSYEDLMTVSYDNQVGNFAVGKTACLHQGVWVYGMLSEIDPDLDIAFLPIPLSDDPSWNNDCLPIGVSNYYAINSKDKSDEEIHASKLFLDFIASTERGHQFIVDECGLIPAFTNITLTPKDPLSQSIQTYVKSGKIIPWIVWGYVPAGFIETDVTQAIHNYYKKNISKNEFARFLDIKWHEARSSQQ